MKPIVGHVLEQEAQQGGALGLGEALDGQGVDGVDEQRLAAVVQGASEGLALGLVGLGAGQDGHALAAFLAGVEALGAIGPARRSGWRGAVAIIRWKAGLKAS